eukprot:scaffold3136_cov102-Cylindrotheca_fusiformis.AAC.9
MISNFHQAKVPYTEASPYYTFDPDPTPSTTNTATAKSKASSSASSSTTTSTKKKKKKLLSRRIFGLGSSKKTSSTSDTSNQYPQDEELSTLAGQSLAYSSASSSNFHQTAGESTDSNTTFGDILRMLDEEDRASKQLQQKGAKLVVSKDRSFSSLAYSEGDGTTLNYSTDGDQSYLEGTHLVGLLGDYSSEEKSSLDMSDDILFQPPVLVPNKPRQQQQQQPSQEQQQPQSQEVFGPQPPRSEPIRPSSMKSTTTRPNTENTNNETKEEEPYGSFGAERCGCGSDGKQHQEHAWLCAMDSHTRRHTADHMRTDGQIPHYFAELAAMKFSSYHETMVVDE